MKNDDESPGRWKPIDFGWRYWNYAIIGIGLVAGFTVWVLPNNWADPEVVAGIERLKERQRLYKEYQERQALRKAEEDRIARENEEMGLIYIDPGTNPFLPPEPRPTPPGGQWRLHLIRGACLT